MLSFFNALTINLTLAKASFVQIKTEFLNSQKISVLLKKYLTKNRFLTKIY